MNIVMICNEYPPAPHGGIGTFVQTMARALTQRAHRVHVLGLGPTNETRRDGDVTIHTIREIYWPRRYHPITSRLRLRRALKRIVRETNADIVEVPDYLGLLPFAFHDCPVTVRLHLSATTIAKHVGKPHAPLIPWCERRTLARHPNWIAVSRYALNLTEQSFALSPRMSAVVYSPIDVSASETPPPLPAQFILFGGTVSPRKGALVLAEAAKQFLPRHADVHLVYAGPLADSIETQIRAAVGEPLQGRVHLLGSLSRGAFLECVRRCDLFAFPSTLETFGLVVAEAMISGKPVVVSNAEPFTEFVEHERTGLLVDPTNSSDLAGAIDRLLTDRVLSARLASAGEEHARSFFSVGRSAAQTLAFYDKVLNNP